VVYLPCIQGRKYRNTNSIHVWLCLPLLSWYFFLAYVDNKISKIFHTCMVFFPWWQGWKYSNTKSTHARLCLSWSSRYIFHTCEVFSHCTMPLSPPPLTPPHPPLPYPHIRTPARPHTCKKGPTFQHVWNVVQIEKFGRIKVNKNEWCGQGLRLELKRSVWKGRKIETLLLVLHLHMLGWLAQYGS